MELLKAIVDYNETEAEKRFETEYFECEASKQAILTEISLIVRCVLASALEKNAFVLNHAIMFSVLPVLTDSTWSVFTEH